MADPFTVGTIATLAFTKFIESSAGELAKNFTQRGIEQMDTLRQKIWAKLMGNPRAEAALKAAEDGSKADIEKVTYYLKIEMNEDEDFATEIQALAQQIQAGKIQDQNAIQMEVTGNDNTNIQAKAEQGGTQYIAETININQQLQGTHLDDVQQTVESERRDKETLMRVIEKMVEKQGPTVTQHIDTVYGGVAGNVEGDMNISSPKKPVQSHTNATNQRLSLFQKLVSLPGPQFGQVLFGLNPPAGNVPPAQAPQSNRVSALLDWASSPIGCGLDAVEVVYNQVINPQ